MVEVQRRRRDPEARRFAMVTAAAELITEIGVDAITHRMVAARANVPLGATTQYFATLDDLRAAALQLMIAHVDLQMAETRAKLTRTGVTPASLATLVHTALADAKAVRTDRAVVTAAVYDSRLRELAKKWSDEIIGIIAPVYGLDRAKAASAFIDGVLWHAQIHEEPLSLLLIQNALTGILEGPAASVSHTSPAHFA